MMDAFLRFIEKILMEEGTENAACMQQVDHASYQAIFRAFHKILGADSYGDDAIDPHLLHQRIRENGPYDKQHGKVVNSSDRLDRMRNEPGISLLFVDHPQSCTQQEGDETVCTLKHDSGFRGHSMPTKSIQIAHRHAMKDFMCSSGSHLGSNEAVGPFLSSYETLVQKYHNAFKLHDEALDVMAYCYAVVEALGGHRCMTGLENGHVNYKPPSADEEFSLKLAEVDLSFEKFKLDDVYADLYVAEPSSSHNTTGAAGDRKHNGDKKDSLGSKLGKRKRLEVQVFVDVKQVLVRCAQAVSIGNMRSANKILQEIRQVHGASANGTSLQRIAHLFSKVLVVRMRGMGDHHIKAMSHKIPSIATVVQPSNFEYEVLPFRKLMHYFANQSILKAAEGVPRLHIVDYGLMYGIQWPCLINALADRKGGPPLLVITGIQFSLPGIDPAQRLEKSRVQLAAYAKAFNVPFQYHAIVCNECEDLDVASLNLHEGEVLVVNCIMSLSQLAEKSVGSALITSPLQKMLTFMKSLNPHLMLTSVRNYFSHNSPFFVSRYHEALNTYSNMFDMLDTLWGDTPQRHLLERSFFYNNILNIVCCEHTERIETYKKWHVCFAKAGFEQVPIPPAILSRSSSYVKQHHHKDFLIHDDANGWMLMGWKGRTMFGISAWKPSACVEGSGNKLTLCRRDV